MDLGLKDRVYVVTGGTRGLGLAAARALTADGARVVVSGLKVTPEAAAGVVEKLGGAEQAVVMRADNGDPQTPDRLINEAPRVRPARWGVHQRRRAAGHKAIFRTCGEPRAWTGAGPPW